MFGSDPSSARRDAAAQAGVHALLASALPARALMQPAARRGGVLAPTLAVAVGARGHLTGRHDDRHDGQPDAEERDHNQEHVTAAGYVAPQPASSAFAHTPATG
jgi:hypothetical protein